MRHIFQAGGGRLSMQIIRSINTSAAIGLDSAGHEVVLLGKGIGFPKMPYELTDLSVIDRSFYDVDPRYLEMLASLREPVLMASADLVEQAEINLNCSLNPNLPFTLADHLQFAMERIAQGIDLTAPLAYDVQHLYPNEYELGLLALDILQDYTSTRLPDSEAVTIALHLINAEAELGDDHGVTAMLQIISEVDDIVERKLDFRMDKESYSYSRFAMHLRYLIQRLSSGTPVENLGGAMLKPLAMEYPDIYMCALAVRDHLKKNYGWHCNDEETLYLMLHINRVREKEQSK